MPRKSKSKKGSNQKNSGSKSKKSKSTPAPSSESLNFANLAIEQLEDLENEMSVLESETISEPEPVTKNAVDMEDAAEAPGSSEIPKEVNINQYIDGYSDHYSDCEQEDYNLSLESGYGVPIVKLCGREEAGQQFQLDEAALAQLVARAGAARPVVLLSVAGAFRGGKSFLLGFMLRYLRALSETGEEPAGDAWLGAEEEPLRGFSWRGGCERETTGIVVWSQPFPVTLPSGVQVVVLLMDTQGAFDEHSSLRDCSLVFALSTLLASAQVYNVAGQLREDSLQHLQLFTEYAAAGGGGLAALWLLLRDWSAPHEYEYGAAGGARYLQHKLRIAEEQPREARELRQRLASSFDELSCFLMPHPGLRAATDPAFQGKLSELTDEFKLALRELVPLLLAPARLRVKRVAGRPLTARELPVLLRTYLDEFNTRVPSPQTMLSAAARAAWLCAREEARARVSAAAPARALSRGPLRARLSAAALDALLSLTPLAERAGDLPGLADFEKELDVLTDRYIKSNDDKFNLAIAEAKNVFESIVRDLQDKRLCLNPLDLTAMIDAAQDAAVERFDRDIETDAADPDWIQFKKDLNERSESVLKKLSEENAAKNTAAVAASSAELENLLPDLSSYCWRPDLLDAKLEKIREYVLEIFYERREGPSKRKADEFVHQIESKLSACYSEHRKINESRNKTAVDVAYKIFCNTMDEACGGFRLKKADLRKQLTAAVMKGKTEFMQKRFHKEYNIFVADPYLNLLEEKMRSRFAHYLEKNRDKFSGQEVAEVAATVGGAALVALQSPRIGLPALVTAVVAAYNKKPGSD